jgi:hypothetical protein
MITSWLLQPSDSVTALKEVYEAITSAAKKLLEVREALAFTSTRGMSGDITDPVVDQALMNEVRPLSGNA